MARRPSSSTRSGTTDRGRTKKRSSERFVRRRTMPTTSDRELERGAILGARWRFLAEASTILERSLDYKETLTNVVRLVVPRIADYAGIALLDDDGSLT